MFTKGSVLGLSGVGLAACCSTLVFGALSLVFGVGVAFASGGESWWHVQQVSVPSYISPAAQHGEEQRLEVTDATPGEASPVFEIKVEGKAVATFGEHETIKHEAGTTANVQKALEAMSLESVGYGPGSVSVTGGAAGSAALIVTSVGPELGRTVKPIELVGFFGVGVSAVVSRQAAPAGDVVVRAIDIGDGPIAGASSPVSVSDVLPAGLEAAGISGTIEGWFVEGGKSGNSRHGVVNCVLVSLTCTYGEDAAALSSIDVTIPVVVVEPATASGDSVVDVSGGGAPAVSRPQMVNVSELPVPFGVEAGSFEMAAEEEGGVADARAGSHPFQFTTAFTFANTGENGALQPAQPRDLTFLTSPGLVGNAQLMPRCTIVQFDTLATSNGNGCPADTAVGFAVVWISGSQGGLGQVVADPVPVFNLVPGAGEPARFGFFPGTDPVYLTTSVRTGGDYGVTVDVDNIPQLIAFNTSLVSFWGAPNSPVHDSLRGNACLTLESTEAECAQGEERSQVPFLTMPDSCTNTFQGTMSANSWTLPEYLEPIASTFKEQLDGCNQIPFSPSVEVAPDVQSSSSTGGLTAHVKLPQKISEDASALGEGTIKDTTVALPAGVELNPSDAGGLESCSESQIGYLNKTGPNSELEFTGSLPEGWEEGQGGFCPTAAKIGTVSITTPLLGEPVKGAVYLATPYENPFPEGFAHPNGSLLAMYIVAEAKEAGVAVKLPGKVGLCENAGETIAGIACGAQGQLISTFQDTPQLPFSDLELHFFGGERSPLSTPAHCGAYTTQAVFTPWSGGQPTDSTSTFDITSGPHGSACPRRVAVRTVADGGHDEQQRRWVQRVHVDDGPRRRQSEPAGNQPEDAPGPVGVSSTGSNCAVKRRLMLARAGRTARSGKRRSASVSVTNRTPSPAGRST